MDPAHTGEFSSEFWKEIPDDILEELYDQLSVPGDTQMGEATPAQTAAMQQQQQQQQQQRQQPQQQRGQLPPLFQNSSFSSGGMDQSADFSWPGVLQQTAPNEETVKARAVLSELSNLEVVQQVQIDKLRQLQFQVLGNPQESAVAGLQQQMVQLNNQIQEEQKQLLHLCRSFVLEPAELHATRHLAQKLQLQQQCLELLRQELHQAIRGEPIGVAMLLVEGQPIPQVIFKGKIIEDEYSVRLVVGTRMEVRSVSNVKAALVSEEKVWKIAEPLENDTCSLDAYNSVGTFSQIKVKVSSRMAPVYLKFGIQVLTSNSSTPVTVQSNASFPIIAITNESQWCEAQAKLLIADTFAGQSAIPWPQFANGLHHHFLKATRQDPAKPNRTLTPQEFSYIHQKFFRGQAEVTSQQADEFWRWFGQITQTLRFKRHINFLWFSGLIYGLITKNQCNMALANQEVGTFMMRFSESYPGLFAIAYVSEDMADRVKHYLVKPDDTGSQKTLPDFLRDKPQFQHIYQLDIYTGQLHRYPKDTVFHNFYSKTKRLNSEDNGYVLL